jgi:SynChlorMet cassette radical SAM/SPASM protein ScmE
VTNLSALENETVPKVMRSPRTVHLEISSECNLRCHYCYYFDNSAVNYTNLPTNQWLQFFVELGSLAVMNVSLAGGEPFLRPDLKELIEGIIQNKMRFNILSNGTLIDDPIAEYIAGTRRCDYVQVSIDGASPKVHDSCRGKGSFVKAVGGIKTLQRHNVPVAVRVTLHHHNIHDLENITRFLLDELGISSFGTNSAGYIGACRKNAGDVLLTNEDRQIAMHDLFNLSQKYPGRIAASAGPLYEAKYWRKMEMARINHDPAFPNCGHLTACGCPFNEISVRADGMIIPCSMLAHVVLGRINRDSLQNVWLNNPELNRLRMRRKIPLNELEFCRGCDYMPYCTGNCPGTAFNLTDDINSPSPDACLRKFLAEGGNIP